MGRRLIKKPKTNTRLDYPEALHLISPAKIILFSILCYLSSQIVILVFLYGISLILGGDIETIVSDEFLNQSWVSLSLLGANALIILAVLFVILKKYKISLKALGLNKFKNRHLLLLFGAFIGYAISLTAVSSLISNLVPSLDFEQTQEIGFADAAGWQLMLAFIGLVIITPFVEELLFRGFVYKGLARPSSATAILVFGMAIAFIVSVSLGPTAAWLIAGLSLISFVMMEARPKWGATLFTSMLFGLAHMQWNVAIDTFVLSLFLIWLYERTGTIWSSVFLHAIKNLLAFLFVFGIITI